MKELTKEQAIAEHRKMWRWIAEETEKRREIVYKGEYLIKYFPDDDIYYSCFCCEYAIQKMLFENDRGSKIDNKCTFCPIDWGGEVNAFMCERKDLSTKNRGLYFLWVRTNDWKEAAELAREIAELPERKEV